MDECFVCFTFSIFIPTLYHDHTVVDIIHYIVCFAAVLYCLLCVGFEGHSALRRHGLHLYSIIREIKGVGGIDTVGVACGAAIAERVYAELEGKIGKFVFMNVC